jgi:cellulose biosynthesis protein BcsQ
MVTLTIVGPRAGSGKTTTAVNLAAELAVGRWRVALLDLDPMASATLALGHLPAPDPWMAGAVAVSLGAGALGSLRLGRAGGALASARGHDVRVLMEAWRGSTDVLVIDLPSGATALTTAAVEAADVLLTPVSPEGGLFDVRSAAQLRTVLGGAATELRVALVRVAGTETDDLRSLLEDSYPAALCRTEVPEDAAAAQALRLGVPLRVHAPGSAAASAYRQLALELTGENLRREAGSAAA